jgi:23S rRNA (pseudouridine1915-N3)-methyltransferase
VKIFLYYIGKAKSRDANALATDYVSRISHYARCEMREVDPRRFSPAAKHPSAVRVYLDPEGARMDSAAFAAWIGKLRDEGRDIVFAVGDADGLPEEWQDGAGRRISLSPMTFPHELARAMLAEQIYRAFTILHGHPYPR